MRIAWRVQGPRRFFRNPVRGQQTPRDRAVRGNIRKQPAGSNQLDTLPAAVCGAAAWPTIC